MSKASVNVRAGGALPVLPILGLIFVTLKLTGYIAWSWWWVLAPFWALPVLFLLALATIAAAEFIRGMLD